MFASLLRPKKAQTSETTPLLAALKRYRSRRHGVEEVEELDDAEAIEELDGEEAYEDEDRRRDGPLLPVFSSTFLGMCQTCMRRIVCSANQSSQTAYQSTTPPTRFA